MRFAARLKLTAFLCTLLTLAVGATLFQAHLYQQKIYSQLNHSMRIQLSIDSLRSQLWLYEEYSDQMSLNELNTRQANLAFELTRKMQWNSQQQRVLDNLNRLNTNIRVLFNTQLSKSSQIQTEQERINSERLLKAKYSMNIERMTEDMTNLHQLTIAQAKQTQQTLLIVVSVVVFLLSLTVTLWSSMTLFRFRQGMKTLIIGMKNLAEGHLHSRIKYQNTDEFSEMAQHFNQMTSSLESTTIKKEALKEEVARQTQKLTEQQVKLTYLAEHDELTAIYNRRAFIKQIDLAITRDARSQQQAALLFIDLDRFKIINDTLGHQTGDEVLTQIAKRLIMSLRSSDFVGRFGGDEFVVWLDFIESRTDIIAKTQQILDVIKLPMKMGNDTINVGASIGISQFPAHGKNSLTLITAADTAMYIAKHDPHREYCLFEDIDQAGSD